MVMYADGCKIEPVQCSNCSGTGFADIRNPEWDALGKILRSERQDADLSMGEFARAIGGDVVTLNDAEKGRTDPAPFLNLLHDRIRRIKEERAHGCY